MDSIRIAESVEDRIIECAVNPPTLVSGIKVVGIRDGLVYLAVWVRQPSICGGMEASVIERFVMPADDFARDNASNREMVLGHAPERPEGNSATH